ncbi:SPOR domain-containing protein [Vibrio pectenicida]|uniref:SPOR domain-containing protein n=1 Tax=Vibrio pectenicida TaxID=62763 RepID=A0A3R9FQR5_9VIBR|nr:SPOR domain-containing protein [Vibrio pectenicida]RSD32176.1 SPOR domain-containing protein [Vibrio pectenicida]
MAVKSKRSVVVLMSLITLGLSLSIERAYAKEFLCDATQASNGNLPLLDSSCPIGTGMWGKHNSQVRASYFWIQCGVYTEPLALSEAKKIYPYIDSDVWAKSEGNVYRCLIGPYKDFAKAKHDLAQVKQLPDYEEAFIRQILNDGPKKNTMSQPAAITSKKQSTVVPNLSSGTSKNSQELNDLGDGVSIRHKIIINGVEYTVPYSLLSNDQFYMEHDLPWNRMSYDMAYNTCDQMGMRLASHNEWQSLLNAKIMMRDKWPMHLPYWGEERAGLFYTGKVKPLKESSLLNIMCVK